MKNAIFTLIIGLSLLFAVHLEAQESQSNDSVSNGSGKAITFDFDGFRLSGGLGGTFWVNSQYAVRVLLSGSYSSDKDLLNNITTHTGSIGGTVYLIRHFPANRVLSPYVGAGIGLGYSQNDYGYYYYHDEVSKSGSITIPGIAGIEYWFKDNISLSAEQSVGLLLSVTRTDRSYRISNTTSSLLLSIYY